MGIFVQNVPEDLFYFIFFKSIEYFICLLDLYIFSLQVFVQKRQHCNPVKILDWLVLGVFSYKIYPSFFFFFPSCEFSIFFLDLYTCYLQVFVQKRRHYFPIKILDQLDLHFRSKFAQFFFFI